MLASNSPRRRAHIMPIMPVPQRPEPPTMLSTFPHPYWARARVQYQNYDRCAAAPAEHASAVQRFVWHARARVHRGRKQWGFSANANEPNEQNIWTEQRARRERHTHVGQHHHLVVWCGVVWCMHRTRASAMVASVALHGSLQAHQSAIVIKYKYVLIQSVDVCCSTCCTVRMEMAIRCIIIHIFGPGLDARVCLFAHLDVKDL